jgi:hypothetical protein
MIDTATQQERDKRLGEIVEGYKATRNWSGLARVVGGSPRHDLQDYSDADAGEPRQGARW